MKPSVILYKALPDDLHHRLEEHFTVTQVKDLSPQTVAQHADAFAHAKGCWAPAKKWMPHCWKKCRSFVPPLRFPWGMTTLT